MAYSYVRYTGNGTTTNYTFSFPYISSDHIKVRVNGSLVTNWTYLNSSTIQFTSAPANGSVVEIRRETPKNTAIVNFTDGSVLLERDLDLLATFDLYLAQETKDGLDASISQTSVGVFDALNKRITNVADPVGLQDAVTKNYIDNNFADVAQPYLDAASSSATSAGNSAAAASSSASASASSAASSAASASAAAASYDNFDDRYLGPKAVAPTVDNDGNTLLVGAMYWDTVSSQMFVWSGTSWKPTFVTGNTVRSVVTATGGQTVVATPTYVIGNNSLQVYANGVKLIVGTDYTETTQNSITLTSGLTAGDELELIAFQAYPIGTTSADNVSFQQAGTGSTLRSVAVKLNETVSVKDFGAVGNGVADDTAAIQAAIDSVCPTFPLSSSTGYAGIVFFPPGKYRVTSPINCTNTRVNGTRQRDFLRLFGAGASIIGETGSGKPIIEVTGAQFLEIDRGITLDTVSASSNKSTVGLFQGVSSVLPQTQNQKIGCRVDMHDDAAANGGLGTVAVWNFGAEENTYDTVWWRANVAMVLTSANDGTQPGAFTPTSYTTLASSHSLGMTTVSGECFFVSKNRRSAPLIIQNVTASRFENTYLANEGTGGTNKAAIWLFGNAVNTDFNGVVEGVESLKLDGSLINSNWRITWGGVDNTSEPVIRLKRTASSTLKQSNIFLDLEANFTRTVVTTDDGDESTAANYSVLDSSITAFRADNAAFLDTQFYLPTNVATNASSFRWNLIGGNRQVQNSSFAAGPTSDTLDVTGDGTVYAFNTQAWSKVFDIGNCFNAANGIFTAKQSGQYEFYVRLACTGGAVAQNDAQLVLVVNGQGYLLARLNPGANMYAGSTEFMLQGSAKVVMTTGQTAYIQLYVGGGTKTVDILSGVAGTNYRTRFEGRKIY